ncbi:hypothetical protein GGI25_000020 [Coemansia spiralis]|uniref:glucan endo-1,3-beta-D-glucosidase n=2 Tax=Coemansia TaxID=4863 RepID=A0A9W8GFD2_9FUNG|nr:hypothetical protein EDC05_004406 [Coemansia umbellata]KAJ2623104.1 hypothetical protein GGI26_002715 [Coemansia sp. RSA 1358]KAJ2681067.1 hypothetical protein GGI25_000020 [Coemansia spiralis]
MRASVTSLLSAVLATGSMLVTASPLPGNIGNAVVLSGTDVIEIQYSPAPVDWNTIDWSSIFAAQQAATASPTPISPTTTAVVEEASYPVSSAPVQPSTYSTYSPPVFSTTVQASQITSITSTTEAPTTIPSAPSGSSGSALWGLTYSPYNNDGSCPSLDAVASQLKTVASVAGNIRLYSTDCSQLRNAVQAINNANLGIGIYAGIWISDGAARTESDLTEFISVAKTYGTSLIKGVSVGNEEISKGMSEATIISNINNVRARLQKEGLGSIPVYTTEQDATFTKGMAAVSDVVQINVYSIFDSMFTSIDASVQSVIHRANTVKTNVAGGKPVRFGESGWSSTGSTGPSPLTLANEIAYAQKFKCAAASAGYTYFYFEAKNADWKKTASASEQNFGIFNANFSPKFSFSLLDSC